MRLRLALALASAALLAHRGGADVVIPSAALVKGAGGSEFHSDVRVFNPTASPARFVPVFYDQPTGATIDEAAVTIPPRTQLAYDNVLATLFGRSPGSFGPIRFQTSAPLLVSSSVNNVNACQGGGGGQENEYHHGSAHGRRRDDTQTPRQAEGRRRCDE